MQASKISAIYCQQQFGVSKNYLRFVLLNIFNPSASLGEKLPAVLSYHKLIRGYVSKTLESAGKGYIVRDGIKFIVVYHGCTRASCKYHSTLLLSFRAAHEAYDLPAYVLIKPYYTDNKQPKQEIEDAN